MSERSRLVSLGKIVTLCPNEVTIIFGETGTAKQLRIPRISLNSDVAFFIFSEIRDKLLLSKQSLEVCLMLN